nr:hypothetical protein Iba_chr04eCG13390 [Ipomoea batatas]
MVYSLWFETRSCCCLASPKLEDGVHCCNSAVGKKKRGNWKKERHRRCFLRSIGIYGGSPELCTLPRTNAGGRKATYVAAAGCHALFCLTPSIPRWRPGGCSHQLRRPLTAAGDPCLPLTAIDNERKRMNQS